MLIVREENNLKTRDGSKAKPRLKSTKKICLTSRKISNQSIDESHKLGGPNKEDIILIYEFTMQP